MAKPPIKFPILNSIGNYITFIFKTLGLIYDKKASNTLNTENIEDTIDPFMKVLSDFRIKVRDAAKAKDPEAVLKACDEVRDNILPHLGVRLEDKAKVDLFLKIVLYEYIGRIYLEI